MRPYDGYSDDFDDIEGFAYDKSRSMQRLIDEARREERQRNRFRSSTKDRHHLDNWNWDDDDDNCIDYNEDLNRHY